MFMMVIAQNIDQNEAWLTQFH